MLANGIQKDRRMVWDFKGIDKIKFIDSEEFEDVLDDQKIKCLIWIERDKKINWNNKNKISMWMRIQILLHI